MRPTIHGEGAGAVSHARGHSWRAGTAVALAAFSLASTSTSAQTLTPILTNGPGSNRVNLVVLSEGYTSAQLGQFLVDATNLVNNFLGTRPYQEYRSYFNAYAISVASAQSGADHLQGQPLVDTYFNSVYEYYDYVITIPPNGRNPKYADGQGKVDALVANFLPQADIVMLLVNDIQPGGSSGLGGTNGTSNRKPIITALGFAANDIPAHESGHYFAGLVDEYASATPPAGYTPAEAPNSTKETNRTLIKWRAWIEPTTPVPTPYSFDYYNLVGLFDGAQYQTTGWYRPKFDCKMRTLGTYSYFCEVCSEQIVKTIYQAARPVDGFSPGASNQTFHSTQPAWFSVTPLQPRTHNLSAQWYTNNIPVPDATNVTFQLQPGMLGNGTHAVRIVVRDETALVRNDPARLLWATNTWSATVSLSELWLSSAKYLSDGRFRLTVTGTAPRGFAIQASTNLTNWVKLTTNSLANGKFDYTNTGVGGVLFRYYRTVSPP